MGRGLHRVAVMLALVLLPCMAVAQSSPSRNPFGPILDRFVEWVDRADLHRADWERESAGLTSEQRSRATRLADKQFGGIFGGYWTSLHGYANAAGAHFLSQRAVREAPPEIVAPARSYLLWRLATVRANDLRRDLGSLVADEPEFWDSFDGLVAHGRHFGLMSDRSARVIPKVIAESVLGDRLYEKGLISVAAARAMLASARWSLRESLLRFEEDQVDKGVFLVTDAMRSLERARSFGVRLYAVRAMLRREFERELASDEIVTVYQGVPFTFRDALQDGIAYRMMRSDRNGGFNLRPFAELLLARHDDESFSRPEGVAEDVLVEAEAVWLNFRGYVLRELQVVVDDVAGRLVARRYADIEMLGRLLFAAMLHEIANDEMMARIRSAYATWILSQHGTHLAGDELTRSMTAMGHRVFDVPGVAPEFQRSLKTEKLLRRLVLIDIPGLQDRGTKPGEAHPAVASGRGVKSP